MKKLGQKLSFLTKVLLVVGLLISNLSSLSVVFAYEGETLEDVVIELVDDTLEISYTETLADGVEAIDVKVYENYTYLDGSSEEQVEKVYSLTAEQLLAAQDGELELTHKSIFATEEETVKNFELFDGTYSAKVEIVDVTVYPEETGEETETEVIDALEETTEIQNAETEVLEEETEVVDDLEENIEVQNVETGIILADAVYEETMTHDSGLNIKLFDSNGTEISLVDKKYSVFAEDSKVKVVAQILSGGLNPDDIFKIDGVEYFAEDLLAYEFSSEEDFSGRLFGEYELPVTVELEKVLDSETTEEVVYTESVNILYESYEMNALLLNMVAGSMGYGESYLFYNDTKDGVLYVLSDIEEVTEEETEVTKTMLDLYNMLNVALEEDDETEEPIITYTLLKNGINVLEAYDVNGGVTLEDYLATILLDETVEIVLSNEGLTVTYKVVVAGDLNNDNVITTDDVLELINQVVGESEVTDLEKSDLYGFDGEVNSLDVLCLNQVVKTKVWNAEITEIEASLNASLDVKLNGANLSEENYLTSGDEFTVDYVLSVSDYEINGIAGVFNYDETLFELVSVEVADEWLGNSKDGKFLYLGEESLTGPELEITEPEEEIPETSETENTETVNSEELAENTEIIEEVNSLDYVVLTATFKALKSTDEESNNVITLEEIELFNSTDEVATNYILDQNTVSTEAILVNASEDNTLQYLEIAGIEIALEEGVYEYEITVASDVTAVDLKYILSNVAANVTSAVFPEELAEGNNTVVITVTSESGISQDYTVTVIREEVEEETTTQVNYDNGYNDYEEEEETVVTEPTEEDDEEVVEDEEESNISRIIIIILILLVIAGLVYLIFKDEDDEETKKANKAVNKLKKESIEPEVIKTNNKTSNKKPNNNSKNNNSKNAQL